MQSNMLLWHFTESSHKESISNWLLFPTKRTKSEARKKFKDVQHASRNCFVSSECGRLPLTSQPAGCLITRDTSGDVAWNSDLVPNAFPTQQSDRLGSVGVKFHVAVYNTSSLSAIVGGALFSNWLRFIVHFHLVFFSARSVELIYSNSHMSTWGLRTLGGT